jgi:hypothetical protein
VVDAPLVGDLGGVWAGERMLSIEEVERERLGRVRPAFKAPPAPHPGAAVSGNEASSALALASPEGVVVR